MNVVLTFILTVVGVNELYECDSYQCTSHGIIYETYDLSDWLQSEWKCFILPCAHTVCMCTFVRMILANVKSLFIFLFSSFHVTADSDKNHNSNTLSKYLSMI